MSHLANITHTYILYIAIVLFTFQSEKNDK